MTAQDFLLVAGEVVRGVAAGSLGVFAGAMLTEAGVLVPYYWRSLEATEFYEWYGANARRLVGFFGPLTWLGGVSALVGALLSLWTRHASAPAATVAAALTLAIVATFPIYFKRANASFVSGTNDAVGLREELGRWAAWHRVRTALSLGGLVAAIVASR